MKTFGESTSATPDQFYWMRYSNDRATNVTVGAEKLRISKNDLFGVRELRGKDSDEILLTTGVKFRLSVAKSEQLMNKAKEFKGKTPVLSTPAKSAKPVDKNPRSARYQRLLNKVSATLTVAAVKKVLPMLADDAERVDFKAWAISKTQSTGVALRGAQSPAALSKVRAGLQAIVVGGTVPKRAILVVPKRATTITKLVPAADSNVTVRLSHVELPDVDDFTDHEIPHEFRQYTRSESADVATAAVWKSFGGVVGASAADVGFQEFSEIVKGTIAPFVKRAKAELNDATELAATKVKSWALLHFKQATQLGKPTQLFEKLINNPKAAVRQIVSVLMADAVSTSPAKMAEVAQKKEEAVLDDLLAGLKL